MGRLTNVANMEWSGVTISQKAVSTAKLLVGLGAALGVIAIVAGFLV